MIITGCSLACIAIISAVFVVRQLKVKQPVALIDESKYDMMEYRPETDDYLIVSIKTINRGDQHHGVKETCSEAVA